MKDILEEILIRKRAEVEQAKRRTPLRALKEVRHTTPCRSMREALLQSPSGIIAEFKRKSPSKGWIRPDGQAAVIPAAYAGAGAAALSILTDEPTPGPELPPSPS